MKSFNIFKKESKTSKVKFQKLEKEQLKKILGGGDEDKKAPKAIGSMNFLTCWPS